LERIGVAFADETPELSQLTHPERDSSCAAGGPALTALHLGLISPLNQMRERGQRCLSR
jgi:hypothetical protein